MEIVRSLHLGEELLRGHGLEDKRKQSFADVDLASADCDAYSGKALQVKMVPLEPGLRRANVTAHGRARRAESFLEVGDVDRLGGCIEKCREYLELAVVAVEHPRTRDRTECRQDRAPPVVIPRDPDANATAPHDPKALGAKVRVDRWQVVADDPTGQLELARDRLNGRRPRLGQQQTRDRRLSAIEWNDRHGGPNLNLRPSPPRYHWRRAGGEGRTSKQRARAPVGRIPRGPLGVLLPDVGLAIRGRGRRAGDVPARVARLRRLRGPVGRQDLDPSDRHERLSGHAAKSPASVAADGPRPGA